MKDALHRELTVGDYVATAQRGYSEGEFQFGKLLKIDKGKLTVISCSYRDRWDRILRRPISQELIKNERVGTYEAGKRLLILDPADIPQEIKDLLG